MIFTSYFGNLKNLPKDIVPIAICGKIPDWYDGLCYRDLAPKYKFFMEWKKNHDNNYYIEHYNEEVLDNLCSHFVVGDLYDMAEGKNFALICYEKPDEFCHRHLVADWLTKNGYPCIEYHREEIR